MSYDKAYFVSVQTSLRQVLSELHSAIPHTDREEIKEFIEHNELGLALEWLCASVTDNNVSLTEKQHEAIRQIAEQMQIDADWWQHFRNR